VSVDEERGATLLFGDCADLSSYPRTLWIKLKDEETYEAEKSFISTELADRLGPDRCMIYIESTKRKVMFDDDGTMATPQLLEKLKAKLGDENVTVSVGTYWKNQT